MLLNINLRVDLFGNHYIDFENKISVKINKFDYEDISYFMMKLKNERLKNYNVNAHELIEICNKTISCKECSFSDEEHNCCLVTENDKKN